MSVSATAPAATSTASTHATLLRTSGPHIDCCDRRDRHPDPDARATCWRRLDVEAAADSVDAVAHVGHPGSGGDGGRVEPATVVLHGRQQVPAVQPQLHRDTSAAGVLHGILHG